MLHYRPGSVVKQMSAATAHTSVGINKIVARIFLNEHFDLFHYFIRLKRQLGLFFGRGFETGPETCPLKLNRPSKYFPVPSTIPLKNAFVCLLTSSFRQQCHPLDSTIFEGIESPQDAANTPGTMQT